MNEKAKPVPVVNAWSKPYWEAANENKFVIQKCKSCGKYNFIPRMVCPHCFGDELEWVEASGKGTVYSYTTVLNNAPSAFAADVPYVVAIIRLAEGPQMVSNIVGIEPEKIKCDMEVEVTFERLNDQFNLPKWRPEV